MQDDVRSLLTPLGYQAGDCGYCKSENTSQRTPKSRAAYYARSNFLTVETYQTLIDRGWRRSGSLLYKPDVLRACCPHYTIRLPAASFKTSRDQRQAINKWNKFVLGDEYIKEVAKKFPRTKEQKAKDNNEFDLSNSVHAAEYENLKPVKPAHRFEVRLEPDDLTDEKYLLYKRYQTHVHHDKPEDVSRSGFKRFLCESPLRRSIRVKDGQQQSMGSYHQCYRIDGQLVAIGVLDLLPHAVSGVYFIYHPDYEKWSFGKLSALREACLTLDSGYEFYYMGYYIHDCVKMRYKGDYKPQYILDPMTYAWNPLDERLRALLHRNKFVSLHYERETIEHEPTELHAVLEMAESEDDTFVGPDGTSWKYKSPAEATTSGESLLAIRMPGVPVAANLSQEVDLDELQISLGARKVFRTTDLVSWDDDPDITHANSLKGVVAEYAACVGPVVARNAAIDFSR